MKSRGLHLIREPKCGTVVTASAGTIAPPDMELFHDKVPAQLVELAEKVYEQNPLFLADRYSVTSRAHSHRPHRSPWTRVSFSYTVDFLVRGGEPGCPALQATEDAAARLRSGPRQHAEPGGGKSTRVCK